MFLYHFDGKEKPPGEGTGAREKKSRARSPPAHEAETEPAATAVKKQRRAEEKPFRAPPPPTIPTAVECKPLKWTGDLNKQLLAWYRSNFNNEALWQAVNSRERNAFDAIPEPFRDLFVQARVQKATFFSRYGVFIAPSTVAAETFGLFALRAFAANEQIGPPYVGTVMPEWMFDLRWQSDPEVAKRKAKYLHSFPGDDEHTKYVVDPTALDGRLFRVTASENVLPYINEPPSGQRANASVVYDSEAPIVFESIVCVACVEGVCPLQEIFAHYGADYERDYEPGEPCPQTEFAAPPPSLLETISVLSPQQQLALKVRMDAFATQLQHTVWPTENPRGSGKFEWPAFVVQEHTLALELSDASAANVVVSEFTVRARFALPAGTRIPRLGVPVPAAIADSRMRAGQGHYLFTTSRGHFDANPAFDPHRLIGGRGTFLSELIRPAEVAPESQSQSEAKGKKRTKKSERSTTTELDAALVADQLMRSNIAIDDSDCVLFRDVSTGEELRLAPLSYVEVQSILFPPRSATSGLHMPTEVAGAQMATPRLTFPRAEIERREVKAHPASARSASISGSGLGSGSGSVSVASSRSRARGSAGAAPRHVIEILD